MKEKIFISIEKNINVYMEIIKKLYDNPEIGNEEFKSSQVLVDLLQANNFEVIYPFILPTGFKAVYNGHKDGPRIAFLCEYDSLPEVGHGCGHNMIGVLSIATAISLKSAVLEFGGTIEVYGTPAEENFGGKVTFANEGVFDGIDAALMMHPSNYNGLGSKTNAINPVKFEFFGKNAHGCKPQLGRSALDAAVLTYTSINMLRQFQPPHTFIHGIFRNGGEAANVIPGYASLEYYFRGQTMDYVLELTNRAIECAKGACEMAGTTFKHSIYETPYDECNINYTLADCLKTKFIECGVKGELRVEEAPSGSSDIGAVSYRCPALQGMFKIAPSSVLGHSKEMALSTISKSGEEGFLVASKALALVGYELLTDKELLVKIKEEFNRSIRKE